MPFTTPRVAAPLPWPGRIGVAGLSMAAALLLTHALWPLLQFTPFLLGFAAAVISSRLGGREAGFVAVLTGVVGYAWFPPPVPAAGFARLLAGFVVISGAFSWIVARRYEVESALRASEHHLRTVVSSLPVVLWVIKRDGHITLAEGRGLAALHLNPRSLVGRSVYEVFHGEPDLIANTRRALSGEAFTAMVTLGTVAVETWYSPVRDHQGGVTGAIAVSLDVTARQRLEQQYRQSQKLEAIGQLAAGVAHDFNNLLVAIGGYAELVMATFDAGDPRHADLLEVRKATERAGALTRQLLAFSRRQVLHVRVLDVNLLVADVQTLLRRTLGEDVTLVLELGPRVDPIRADPGQVAQVLLNLAVNARDAMPTGGQLRFVTATCVIDDAQAAESDGALAPGRYVRLSVIDSGAGMPPDVQARIFEPFFTTKASGQGTGLGLATVHAIVQQSGGSITVNSHPGRGTTFDVYFPAVQEAVEAPSVVGPTAPTGGGSETILLAEDDGAVRRLASDVLQRSGYTVIEARDGEEALALGRSHRDRIHLLVADLVMPGLGGQALAATLTGGHPALRVLYTSGYGTDVLRRAGLNDTLSFLPKPFLPLDLVSKVREVLDARLSARP